MKDHFDLAGKVALITGGSRGLGRAMAFAFAERGARLVIASRKLEQVEETAEALRATGAEVLGLACHVADWDQCDALFDAAIAQQAAVIADIQASTDAAVYSLREAVTNTNTTVQNLSTQVSGLATQIQQMIAALSNSGQARSQGNAILRLVLPNAETEGAFAIREN